MRNTVKLCISIDAKRAADIRALVERGAYPNISSVFDAAAEMFLEHQGEMNAWWHEAARRYDEAEMFPERMLDPDTSFKAVRSGAKATKASLR